MNMRAPVSVRPDLDVYIGAESGARGWSVYGAERSQPVATSRKWDVAETAQKSQNRCRGLRPVAEGMTGKEGVDGSSPSEGFHKVPANWPLSLSVR
jgi:hypothetical protein